MCVCVCMCMCVCMCLCVCMYVCVSCVCVCVCVCVRVLDGLDWSGHAGVLPEEEEALRTGTTVLISIEKSAHFQGTRPIYASR
jgi:hypothetical protein